MKECPSCDKTFDSSFAVKIHHFNSHGESLVSETTTCDVSDCENEFEYYPSNKEGAICPNCVESGKNIHDLEKYSDISEKRTTYIDVSCFTCEEEFVVTKTDHSERNFCSEKCRKEFNSNRMSGESNPRYKDGKSSGKYYSSDWRKVKEKVTIRDNGKCIICSSENKLHGHHIIPVKDFENKKDAHYVENVILLCPTCHRNVEYGNIDVPEEYIEENGLEEYSDYGF